MWRPIRAGEFAKFSGTLRNFELRIKIKLELNPIKRDKKRRSAGMKELRLRSFGRATRFRTGNEIHTEN